MEEDPNNQTGSSEPRKNLVSVAVQFLLSPRIVKSPEDMKVSFLKKKGLTDTEIQLALQDADKAMSTTILQHTPSFNMDRHQPTFWSFLRNAANTVALFSIFGYVTYVLYKRYGEPFIFGKRKDDRSIESRLAELESLIQESLSEIKENMTKIKEEMEKTKGKNESVLRQDLEDLKAEVKSLKNLFLHRKEFASTILSTSGRTVSIPEWQKQSDEKDSESPSPPETSKDGKDQDDSESSERGTNNGGSDSSLEVIK